MAPALLWLFPSSRIQNQDSLQDFIGTLADQWFSLTQPLRHDLDFVSVDDAILREIQTQKIWVEVKIFRQYQSIFTDFLNEFREACCIIAINTREIAEQAFQKNELEIWNSFKNLCRDCLSRGSRRLYFNQERFNYGVPLLTPHSSPFQ